MTLVLDAGGVSALAGKRARLMELRRRGLWPAQVPAVVLAEALTGDHRRDFHPNRLLRACQTASQERGRASQLKETPSIYTVRHVNSPCRGTHPVGRGCLFREYQS